MFWLIGIIVFLVVAIAVAVSPVAKWYIEKNDTALIGREVNIGKLGFNIFTGRLKVGNLTVFEQDGKSSFITADTLSVRCRLLKLINKKVVVSHAYLKSLNASLIQDTSSLNIDDLIERFSGDTTQVEEPSSWGVVLNDIRLRDCSINYEDLAAKTDLVLDNLNLDIPTIDLSGEKNTDAGVEFDLSNKGHFVAKLTYGMNDKEFDLALSVKDLDINLIAPYIKQVMKVSDIEGLFSSDLVIKGNTDHFSQLSANGEAYLASFSLTDNEGDRVISIDSTSLSIANVDLARKLYKFGALEVDGLVGKYVVFEDGTTNISSLMVKSDSDSTSAEAGQPVDTSGNGLFVGIISVNNALVEYRDESLKKPFDYKISNINVRSKNFNTNGRNNFRITADAMGGGKVNAIWFGNIKDIDNHKFDIEVSNLDLQPFSPYCESMLAYPINNGVLTFLSKNEIKEYQLKSDNSLDIYRMEVGKKIKKAKPEYKVPLRTALYIIKDKNDKISINLPVEGDIHDPDFSYGKIIFKTFCNLLVKITVSPFEYIAQSLGFSSDKLSSMGFNPLSPTLTTEQTDLLNQIVEVLEQKPEFRLSMEQYYEPALTSDSYSLYKLKEEYYVSKLFAGRPVPVKPEAPVDSQSRRGPRLSTLDKNYIIEMSEKDKEFVSYVNEKTRGVDSLNGLGLPDIAKRLYPCSNDDLSFLAAKRDSMVTSYILSRNISSKAFKVFTAPKDSLITYKGSAKYAVSLESSGEQKDLDTAE